eukprot:4937463-Prymnesium_polylepis.2
MARVISRTLCPYRSWVRGIARDLQETSSGATPQTPPAVPMPGRPGADAGCAAPSPRSETDPSRDPSPNARMYRVHCWDAAARSTLAPLRWYAAPRRGYAVVAHPNQGVTRVGRSRTPQPSSIHNLGKGPSVVRNPSHPPPKQTPARRQRAGHQSPPAPPPAQPARSPAAPVSL